MDLDTIKETLTFLGSSGAILFIPKLYLDYKKQKRLQEDQLQDNKVLQEEQHRLNIKLSELKTKQDSIIFMTNRQYEKEFEIYLEIFQSIGNCQRLLLKEIDAFALLNEDVEQSKLLMEEVSKEFKKEIHELNFLNKRYAPFMKKSVNIIMNELIIEFRSVLEEIESEYGVSDINIYFCVENKESNKIGIWIKRINEHIKILENDIRNYLNKIRTI